ncbi:hypothetical protein [Algirhabdus cladophorae]|uniref:hypothetical protein n=1 Tax=Algirhabdus cladophorae TaxID=3377108 RepID=UPI003B84A7ED
MRFLCLLVVFTVSFAAAPVALILVAEPKLGKPIVVVAKPWGIAATKVVEAAQGSFLSPQATRLAVWSVMRSETYATDLKMKGAWLVLDGAALAQICGVTDASV